MIEFADEILRISDEAIERYLAKGGKLGARVRVKVTIAEPGGAPSGESERVLTLPEEAREDMFDSEG